MKRTFEERLELLEKACGISGLSPERIELENPAGVAIVCACQKAVCEQSGLPLGSMLWKGRTQNLANWRICAMFLAFEMSGLSSGKIATLFNRKDHATVLHASREAPKRFPKALLNKLRAQVMLQQNAA